MKRTILLAFALAFGAIQAAQGDGGGPKRPDRPGGRAANAAPPQNAATGPAAAPTNDRLKENARRANPDSRARYFSAEQRRQLRQDINQAGSDIYRRERRRH